MEEKPNEKKLTSFEDIFNDPKTIFITQAEAAGVPELKKYRADKLMW